MLNDVSWMPAIAAIGALFLVELAAIAALGAVLARGLRRPREESARRVAGLAAPPRLLESRLYRLAEPPRETRGADRPARPEARAARDASRGEGTPRGPDLPTVPTLIA